MEFIEFIEFIEPMEFSEPMEFIEEVFFKLDPCIEVECHMKQILKTTIQLRFCGGV